MIKIGDNYYRNLEEQVLKNKQDIADHYNVDRVLGEVGIKVIGQLDTPPIDQIGSEYGDAYAVGVEPPYKFYVWTRADVDSGHPEDYWLNIGQLAIVGPEGPKGDTGPRGERGPRGSYWFAGSTSGIDSEEYDWLMASNGDLFTYTKNDNGSLSWKLYTNIKGPQGIPGERGPQGIQGIQGPQGPQGPRGDVGGFINIYGILTSRNELPDPNTLSNRSIAYLIGTQFPYDLYIQVGDADGPVIWINSGPLNVSTLVYVNGEAQNVWDADTKIGFDDLSSNQGTTIDSGKLSIYPANAAAIEAKKSYRQPIVPAWIDKAWKVAATTNTETWTDNDKTAVCDTIGAIKKPTNTLNAQTVITQKPNSDIELIAMATWAREALYGRVPRYQNPAYETDEPASNMGMLVTNDPTKNYHCANKQYVDDLVGITKTEYNYNFINGYSNRECDVKIYKQRNQLNIIVAGQLNIDPNTFVEGSVQSIIEFTLDEETSRKLFVGSSNTAAGNIATTPGTYYNDQNYQTTVVPFFIRRTTENGNIYWIRFTGSGLTNSSTLTDVNIRLSLPLD